MKIGLVVDSTCDLNPGMLARYKMEMVPLSIHFGDLVYLDRLELAGEEFFKKMEGTEQLPTTSQPSIGLFLKKYQEMAQEYDVILSIHLSAKLSGTYEAAQMAAAKLADIEIKVIDSRSASFGAGYLAILAAEMIEAGKSITEIVSRIEEVREQIKVYFTVNDLTYLQKGGRIGKAQAFLGSILNVYPILTIHGSDGEILPLEKIRGKKKILQRMEELILNEVAGAEQVRLGFVHGLEIDKIEELKANITGKLTTKGIAYQTDLNWISAVLGSHVGPSIYGSVVIKGDFLKL